MTQNWSYKFHKDNKQDIEDRMDGLCKDDEYKRLILDGFFILLKENPDSFASQNLKGDCFLHKSEPKTKNGFYISIVFCYDSGEITIYNMKFQ